MRKGGGKDSKFDRNMGRGRGGKRRKRRKRRGGSEGGGEGEGGRRGEEEEEERAKRREKKGAGEGTTLVFKKVKRKLVIQHLFSKIKRRCLLLGKAHRHSQPAGKGGRRGEGKAEEERKAGRKEGRREGRMKEWPDV